MATPVKPPKKNDGYTKNIVGSPIANVILLVMKPFPDIFKSVLDGPAITFANWPIIKIFVIVGAILKSEPK